jgi:hypothetical protein
MGYAVKICNDTIQKQKWKNHYVFLLPVHSKSCDAIFFEIDLNFWIGQKLLNYLNELFVQIRCNWSCFVRLMIGICITSFSNSFLLSLIESWLLVGIIWIIFIWWVISARIVIFRHEVAILLLRSWSKLIGKWMIFWLIYFLSLKVVLRRVYSIYCWISLT